jgi:hypothetical protein
MSPTDLSDMEAQSIRGRMALQGLYVPTNEGWFRDFR